MADNVVYGFCESKSKVEVPSKSSIVEVTLNYSNWSNGMYSIAVDGVTPTSVQEILPALDITAAQLKALQAANIQDGGQAANQIILKAFGDIPSVNIPIRIILRKDM